MLPNPTDSHTLPKKLVPTSFFVQRPQSALNDRTAQVKFSIKVRGKTIKLKTVGALVLDREWLPRRQFDLEQSADFVATREDGKPLTYDQKESARHVYWQILWGLLETVEAGQPLQAFNPKDLAI